jgi:hypothetical protein
MRADHGWDGMIGHPPSPRLWRGEQKGPKNTKRPRIFPRIARIDADEGHRTQEVFNHGLHR